DAHTSETREVKRVAHPPDCRGRYAGADQVAQFCLATKTSDRARRMTLDHGVTLRRIEALDEPPGMSIKPDSETAGGGKHGEAAADLERVRHLAAEIVDQYRQILGREGLMKHLGRPYG